MFLGGAGNDSIVGGDGDDTLALVGRNLGDATLETDSGVTTISFTDGTVVTTESVETILFDDDILKL
jgi:hypothetical protein